MTSIKSRKVIHRTVLVRAIYKDEYGAVQSKNVLVDGEAHPHRTEENVRHQLTHLADYSPFWRFIRWELQAENRRFDFRLRRGFPVERTVRV